MSPVIHCARTLSLVFFTAGVLSVLGGCEVASQDDELSVSSVACFSQEQRPTLGEAVLAGTPAHLAIASEPIVQSPALGDDLCETDADCVPDGCHATFVRTQAEEMASGLARIREQGLVLNTATDALLGVGAACLATAVVLYFVTETTDVRESRATFSEGER